MRVSTGDLNRVVREAVAEQPPPLRQNRRPKIYFATQVATHPPTIVLITNGPELFDNTYQRYLLKTFRDRLPFRDVPIKLYLRHKHRNDRTPSDGVEHTSAEPVRPGKEKNSPDNGRRPGRKSAKAKQKQRPEVWKDI
jgi:hypothetical protein